MPKFDFNKAVQHFGIGALLKICSLFSEYLFLRTLVDGCF